MEKKQDVVAQMLHIPTYGVCKEYDDSSGEVVHYISTPRIDYVKDVMNPWGVDHRPLDKNRSVFYNHSWSEPTSLPIGKNVWVKSTKGGVIAKTKFAVDELPFAADVYKLTTRGFLNSWSIGFMPVHDRIMQMSIQGLQEYISRLQLDIDINNIGDFDPQTVVRFHEAWTLYEYSKVAVPMNMDAVDITKGGEKCVALLAKALQEDGLVVSDFGRTYFGSIVSRHQKLNVTVGEEEQDDSPDKASMVVQTLIFSKEVFKSADEARKWADEHGYKSDKVDETEDSYRLRQRDPEDFIQDSFRTITLTEGVKAVVGKLKEERSAQPPSDGASAETPKGEIMATEEVKQLEERIDRIEQLLLALRDTVEGLNVEPAETLAAEPEHVDLIDMVTRVARGEVSRRKNNHR